MANWIFAATAGLADAGPSQRSPRAASGGNTQARVPAAIALAVAAVAALLIASPAAAQEVIKIGDINSYKAMSANMGPYRKGADLAVEEINAAGGLLGRKIEIISRDDGANPGDAVRAADELVLNEKVAILTGTILSHIGLAIANYANQHKMLFLASAPLTDKIVWENGNPYTFRLRPSTYSPTPRRWCRTPRR
jgi:branched-chain amino acid transport system substrate-binding protein